MLRMIAAIALAGLGLLGADASGQGQLQPVPRFRAGVDLVVLDVSVLDRNRLPVRGLSAADFTILEDGQPQQMSSFSAVDLPDTERIDSPDAAAWTRDVAPDVRRNDPYASERGIFVIVMDDATPMPREDIGYARRWARSVVERLGPGATAAVVYAFNKSAGQEFTEDHARLLAAIDRFNGSSEGIGPRGRTLPFDRFSVAAGTLYQLAIGTLRGVAENLAGLPQRRKALVFVSVGVPLDIGLNGPELMSALEAESSLETSNTAAGGVVQSLLLDLHQTFLAAQRANVSIYSLDPGGLRAPTVVRSPLAGSARLEGNPGRLNREFLATVSEETGGFAVTNYNDPAPGIRRLIRENASYYLLGYSPSGARAQGKYRRIEVKVNRPGVTVRARNGYFERNATRTDPAPARPDGSAGLDGVLGAPLPSAGLSLRVTAAPFWLPGQRQAGLAVVLGVRQPPPAVSPGPAEERVEVLARAYDERGRNVASERLSATIALRPDASDESRYELLSRLDLEPGGYQLRFAAETALGQTSGSVYYDVDVPDFSKLPVSLSGVVLSAEPGLRSGAEDQRVRSLVPVVPTAEREFGADEHVTAFVRVYQGGTGRITPIAIAVTVRDARDRVVFERADRLETERFSNERSADVRVELPLSSLKPGPHLLSIEAKQGKRTDRRDVRLAIR